MMVTGQGHIRIAALALVAAASAQTAPATPTSSSVQVAARIPTFLAAQPAAAGPAVILFRPGDPASAAEAALIERTLAGASVRTRRVPVESAGGLTGARVVFVTGGLAAHYPAVERLTRAGALTIGFERGCAAAARCVAAVTAGSRVEIFISRTARQASGLKFKSTFLMLVKEL